MTTFDAVTGMIVAYCLVHWEHRSAGGRKGANAHAGSAANFTFAS